MISNYFDENYMKSYRMARTFYELINDCLFLQKSSIFIVLYYPNHII